MLEFIRHKEIIRGKKCAGISVTIQPDDSVTASYVCLVKEKEAVNIQSAISGDKPLDEVLSKLDTSVPVYLNITGKGIMHKKMSYANPKQAIHEILPNASQDSFYAYKTLVDTQQVYVTLARKEKVNDLRDQIVQHGCFVLGISLGPFPLNNVLSLVCEEKIETTNYQIQTDNTRILEVNLLNKAAKYSKIMLGDLALERDQLLPLASAFQFFLNNDANEISVLDPPSVNGEEYFFKKAFQKMGWAVLLFLLLVLILNFGFYFFFDSKSTKLNAAIVHNTAILSKVENLTSEYQTKKQLIEKSGLSHSTKYSFYADRMADVLPGNIKLLYMDINPVSTKIHEDEEILFERNIILVEGETRQSTTLNKWRTELLKEDWVEQVNILDFSQEDIKDPGIFSLEIKIANHAG